jgi:imidazolonepropionase-like amidohydrolase
MRFAFRLAALAALLPAGAATAATLVHAGRLIDGTAGAPRERVTIVVDGDRIRSIDAGFTSSGPGDEVVDLSGSTVLPGFMDMHVHLTGESSPTSEIDSIKQGESDEAYDSVVYAERTLLAGFTTVRNVGDSWNVTIALRKAIAAGKIKGPRVFTAGRAIGTRGGHADATNSFGPFLTSDDPRLNTTCSGADGCRDAVRQRYKDGADSIKITATGGVLSIAKSGSAPQFTAPTRRSRRSSRRPTTTA